MILGQNVYQKTYSLLIKKKSETAPEEEQEY